MAAQTEHRTAPVWLRQPPAGADRAVTLTRSEVARAGIELAESDGLNATSVKRVAGRLRVPAARLEQYLTRREDLLDLMLDEALGELVLADQPGPDWRAGLMMIAEQLYTLAVHRPWLVELIGGRSPGGPNGLRFMECSLAALGGTGLTPAQAAQCVNAVHALVCGSVGLHIARGGAHPRPADGTADRDAHYLQQALADGQYPYLGELIHDGPVLQAAAAFGFGLGVLLDGISARLPVPAGAEV